nr:MAG TPA: portal protein [Caudoviricetes sp.]
MKEKKTKARKGLQVGDTPSGGAEGRETGDGGSLPQSRLRRAGSLVRGSQGMGEESDTLSGGTAELAAPAIGAAQVKELTAVLRKYAAGLSRTKQRIIEAEQWWLLRNDQVSRAHGSALGTDGGRVSKTGWLHNVITSKHADAMEAFPEPIFLPREENDAAEARMLSAVVPCILEQNGFEQTYSDVAWLKCKTGTGVYKVVWDAKLLHGLGDIRVVMPNLLNLFWEPGVKDIQHSKFFFETELLDREALCTAHPELPELSDRLRSNTLFATRFLYDDTVDTSNKSTLVHCYYHRNGRLHYCQYVEDIVLYASENQPELMQEGYYAHGKYPYAFDPLFPIEGSPCGYGYVDLCRSPQMDIDDLSTSFVKNAKIGATPRYFKRADGGVNEEEFLDLSKPLVSVNGNLGEDALRQIDFKPLDGVYVSYYDRLISELRETSGNTETSTGNVTKGVTAAAAIVALQEASGKGSRDANRGSYRAYRSVVELCVELIRQFYDLPRRFRIVGQRGAQEFISYSNRSLLPQAQGSAFGQDMGCRLPVFDIKINAQKESPFATLTQNELALRLYQLGFFAPQNAASAAACLELMRFEGKDALLRRLSEAAQ